MEKQLSNKKYIYNPAQANFFINYGVQVLETGLHLKTKKIFWCFDYYACQEAYCRWNQMCKNTNI